MLLVEMRIWVMPRNDGEAIEIEKILVTAGETVLVSRQPWGASWGSLELDIQERLRAAGDAEIIGVELAGPNPYGACNIDHHKYRDEDRRHPLSSLEQVAARLNMPLNRWQQLVAANDRGYIPAMAALGATGDEIGAVRAQDRAAQGIGPDQERQAEIDIAAAEWRDGKVAVTCPRGVTSAHSDRLFGRARESLLMAPDEWDYYGPRHEEFASLPLPETHWSGGDPSSGYFGIRTPGASSRSLIRGAFWKGLSALIATGAIQSGSAMDRSCQNN